MEKKVKYMIAFLVFFTLITIIVPNAFSKYTETASNTIKINTSRPQYTFKFDANGGTGSMSDLVVKRDVSQNLTANAFERSGYDFIGWNTESDGSGISYTDEQEVAYASVTDGEIITLYAQWFDKSYLDNTTELENYSCTKDVKTFEAPQTGTYILEAWGAQGGSISENVNGTKTIAAVEGGRGGYSYGIVNLNAGDKVYVVVGCQGNELKNAERELTEPGGYNGGGLALSDSNKNTQGSGGGATHFAINQNLGELKNYSSNQNDILLVAGGGGGSYSSADISYYSQGGYGGGLTAGDALIYYDTRYRSVGLLNNGSIYYQGLHVPGAEQNQLSGNSIYYYGTFGSGADAIRNSSGADAGAGGGWYGGNRLSKNYGGGGMAGSGGSGHINTTSLTEGTTLAGNLQIPTHDGTSYMTGNTGDGYAKISLVTQTFTVSFDTDGGSAVTSQTITYGNKATKPSNPTKSIYMFDNWYTDNTYQTVFDFENAVITSDITLYGKWMNVCYDNENITTLSNTTCSSNENITIGDGIICKRAINLHQEQCEYTDGTYHCLGSGYSTTGSKGTSTITYGNCGTSGTLTSGDVFTCDLNGDGEFDELTERFYYISDYFNTSTKTFDTTTAVLVYYNNVTNGVSCNKNTYAYNSDNTNYNGPVTLKEQLPTTSQWSNVTLKNNLRAILAETQTRHNVTSTSGGTLPTAFSYSGYSARLLTAQELMKGCGLSNVGRFQQGELDSCNYLAENTQYTKETIGSIGYYLETPFAAYSTYVWWTNFSMLNVSNNLTANDSGHAGARPVIEVLKSKILY